MPKKEMYWMFGTKAMHSNAPTEQIRCWMTFLFSTVWIHFFRWSLYFYCAVYSMHSFFIPSLFSGSVRSVHAIPYLYAIRAHCSLIAWTPIQNVIHAGGVEFFRLKMKECSMLTSAMCYQNCSLRCRYGRASRYDINTMGYPKMLCVCVCTIEALLKELRTLHTVHRGKCSRFSIYWLHWHQVVVSLSLL